MTNKMLMKNEQNYAPERDRRKKQAKKKTPPMHDANQPACSTKE